MLNAFTRRLGLGAVLAVIASAGTLVSTPRSADAKTATLAPVCFVGVCDGGVCVIKEVPCPKQQ